MCKTNKAAALRHVTKDADTSVVYSRKDALVIIDGNATFHMLNKVEENFLKIALQIFNFLAPYTNVMF